MAGGRRRPGPISFRSSSNVQHARRRSFISLILMESQHTLVLKVCTIESPGWDFLTDHESRTAKMRELMRRTADK